MATTNMKEHKLSNSVILIITLSLLVILYFGCTAQKEITHFEKIEVRKIDSVKSFFSNDLIDLSKAKFVQTSCLVFLPLTKIEMKSIKLLDTNGKIIPAILIGG